MKEAYADAITAALVARRFRIYMRKKHGGAEEAICDVKQTCFLWWADLEI